MAQANRAYRNGARMQRRAMNPQAQLMNALWFCARNYARAQMKEQGMRVSEVEPRQLHLAAEALLKQHWQRFLEEAQALCARANVRNFVQRRMASSSSTFSVRVVIGVR